MIDASWSLSFADIAGHEAAVLDRVRDGVGLLSVFHEDNQAFDPETDDLTDWLYGNNWRLNTLALADGTTTRVDGVDWHGGAYYLSDDGAYLLVPGDGYTTTVVYALEAGGTARRALNANGWSTGLYRLP